MKRRPFLKLSGALAGAFTLGSHATWSFADPQENRIVDTVAGMPYRMLGKTGEKVSVVCYPGFAVVRGEQPEVTTNVNQAFEKGINMFDVAPAYGDGEAEIKLGNALKDHNRDNYFLACKTKMRDKVGAREELERSLERLHTDHFDLYQMHVMTTREDVEQAFGPGGAIETFIEARKEGKVRFLGFSAHTTQAALHAMKHFSFDTVMFPLNFIEYYAFGFGHEVLDLAEAQEMGVIAIKPMCGGKWKNNEQREQSDRRWWYRALEDQSQINNAMNFTLSLKRVATGIPPAYMDLANRGIAAGHQYHQPTEDEMSQIKDLARERLSVFEERESDFAKAAHQFEPDCPYAIG